MKAPDPRQKVGWAAGAIAVLVAAGVAWWGLGVLATRQAEAQALADRMGNPALAALLTDPGALERARRETAEIEKLAMELRAREGSFSAQWSAETAKLAGDGQDWASDPGKWKDQLVAVQSELQQSAADHRVRLAPEFYLGLDSFRQRSPATAEVPALALHLSVAQRLVQLLFEARKAVEQYPTPCEFLSLRGPGSVLDNLPAPIAAGSPAKTAAVEPERKSFQAEIRCSPEVFYQYVRLLSKDPALFILTDVTVSNEKQTFLLRSEIAKKFSTSETAPPASGSPVPAERTKKLLEILAGEESVTASLKLDFVAWRNPEEVQKKAPSPSAP